MDTICVPITLDGNLEADIADAMLAQGIEGRHFVTATCTFSTLLLFFTKPAKRKVKSSLNKSDLGV
jgi:hypothetical protein